MQTKTLDEVVLSELIALRGYGGIRESWMESKAHTICRLRGVEAEIGRLGADERQRGKIAYDLVCCASEAGLVVERLERILRATLNVDGRGGDLDDRRWEVLGELGMEDTQLPTFLILEDRAFREFARRLTNLDSSPCASERKSAADLKAEITAEIRAERVKDRIDDLAHAYRRLFHLIGDSAADEAERLIQSFPRARAALASGPVGEARESSWPIQPTSISLRGMRRLLMGAYTEFFPGLVASEYPANEELANAIRYAARHLAGDLGSNPKHWDDPKWFVANRIEILESESGAEAIRLLAAASAVLERRALWELVAATESSPALYEMPKWASSQEIHSPEEEPTGEAVVVEEPEDEDLWGE
ncbi:hypothetical protein [Microbacterium lacticum]